nr:mucin-12-like [Penaeus vannamei]
MAIPGQPHNTADFQSAHRTRRFPVKPTNKAFPVSPQIHSGDSPVQPQQELRSPSSYGHHNKSVKHSHSRSPQTSANSHVSLHHNKAIPQATPTSHSTRRFPSQPTPTQGSISQLHFSPVSPPNKRRFPVSPQTGEFPSSPQTRRFLQVSPQTSRDLPVTHKQVSCRKNISSVSHKQGDFHSVSQTRRFLVHHNQGDPTQSAHKVKAISTSAHKQGDSQSQIPTNKKRRFPSSATNKAIPSSSPQTRRFQVSPQTRRFPVSHKQGDSQSAHNKAIPSQPTQTRRFQSAHKQGRFPVSPQTRRFPTAQKQRRFPGQPTNKAIPRSAHKQGDSQSAHKTRRFPVQPTNKAIPSQPTTQADSPEFPSQHTNKHPQVTQAGDPSQPTNKAIPSQPTQTRRFSQPVHPSTNQADSSQPTNKATSSPVQPTSSQGDSQSAHKQGDSQVSPQTRRFPSSPRRFPVSPQTRRFPGSAHKQGDPSQPQKQGVKFSPQTMRFPVPSPQSHRRFPVSHKQGDPSQPTNKAIPSQPTNKAIPRSAHKQGDSQSAHKQGDSSQPTNKAIPSQPTNKAIPRSAHKQGDSPVKPTNNGDSQSVPTNKRRLPSPHSPQTRSIPRSATNKVRVRPQVSITTQTRRFSALSTQITGCIFPSPCSLSPHKQGYSPLKVSPLLNNTKACDLLMRQAHKPRPILSQSHKQGRLPSQSSPQINGDPVHATQGDSPVSAPSNNARSQSVPNKAFPASRSTKSLDLPVQPLSKHSYYKARSSLSPAHKQGRFARSAHKQRCAFPSQSAHNKAISPGLAPHNTRHPGQRHNTRRIPGQPTHNTGAISRSSPTNKANSQSAHKQGDSHQPPTNKAIPGQPTNKRDSTVSPTNKAIPGFSPSQTKAIPRSAHKSSRPDLLSAHKTRRFPVNTTINKSDYPDQPTQQGDFLRPRPQTVLSPQTRRSPKVQPLRQGVSSQPKHKAVPRSATLNKAITSQSAPQYKAIPSSAHKHTRIPQFKKLHKQGDFQVSTTNKVRNFPGQPTKQGRFPVPAHNKAIFSVSPPQTRRFPVSPHKSQAVPGQPNNKAIPVSAHKQVRLPRSPRKLSVVCIPSQPQSKAHFPCSPKQGDSQSVLTHKPRRFPVSPTNKAISSQSIKHRRIPRSAPQSQGDSQGQPTNKRDSSQLTNSSATLQSSHKQGDSQSVPTERRFPVQPHKQGDSPSQPNKQGDSPSQPHKQERIPKSSPQTSAESPSSAPTKQGDSQVSPNNQWRRFPSSSPQTQCDSQSSNQNQAIHQRQATNKSSQCLHISVQVSLYVCTPNKAYSQVISPQAKVTIRHSTAHTRLIPSQPTNTVVLDSLHQSGSHSHTTLSALHFPSPGHNRNISGDFPSQAHQTRAISQVSPTNKADSSRRSSRPIPHTIATLAHRHASFSLSTNQGDSPQLNHASPHKHKATSLQLSQQNRVAIPMIQRPTTTNERSGFAKISRSSLIIPSARDSPVSPLKYRWANSRSARTNKAIPEVSATTRRFPSQLQTSAIPKSAHTHHQRAISSLSTKPTGFPVRSHQNKAKFTRVSPTYAHRPVPSRSGPQTKAISFQVIVFHNTSKANSRSATTKGDSQVAHKQMSDSQSSPHKRRFPVQPHNKCRIIPSHAQPTNKAIPSHPQTRAHSQVQPHKTRRFPRSADHNQVMVHRISAKFTPSQSTAIISSSQNSPAILPRVHATKQRRNYTRSPQTYGAFAVHSPTNKADSQSATQNKRRFPRSAHNKAIPSQRHKQRRLPMSRPNKQKAIPQSAHKQERIPSQSSQTRRFTIQLRHKHRQISDVRPPNSRPIP